MEKAEGLLLTEEELGAKKEDMENVNLDNCEVVRREYLAHNKESLVTIKPDGIQFNNTCISKMIGVEYIYLIIDPVKKRLIITACHEDDKDSQKWCTNKDGVRRSRKLRGKPFGDMLYQKMGWSKGYMYRACGTFALAMGDEDRLLMVFELTEAEAIPMTAKQRLSSGVEPEDLTQEEVDKLDEIEAKRFEAKMTGRKTTYAKLGVSYPENWSSGSFGVNVASHAAKAEVSIWDNGDLSDGLVLMGGVQNGQSNAVVQN